MSMQMESRASNQREAIHMPGEALRGFVTKHTTRRLSERLAQRAAKRGLRRNAENPCRFALT